MLRLSLIRLSVVFYLFASIIGGPLSYANGLAKSIYETSINWEDEKSRADLLQAAPAWDGTVIHSLFNSYLSPSYYQLPRIEDQQQFNIQFVNAFWGPLNNPFNKYPRPAKAFVMFQPSNDFYMAPLIKNTSDNNYYIFDKTQTQPILLSTWISELQQGHPQLATIRFNICNGYGNVPSVSCTETTYADEASSLSSTRANIMNDSRMVYESTRSAHRDINQDWTTKINQSPRARLKSPDTIYRSSIKWQDEAARNKLLDEVASWTDYKTILNNFEKIRDLRYFHDEDKINFPRRITWLYPDDGCWTRAAAVIRDLFGPLNSPVNQFVRPSKVFAFGNLCAKTANHPNSRVTWWYHTAPIIKDAQTKQTYVLDPSIDPDKPLSIEKWVAAISSNSGACEFSKGSVKLFNICNGYGTGPYSDCHSPYQEETAAMLNQSVYRPEERARQIELNREADAVLGDLPPWL